MDDFLHRLQQVMARSERHLGRLSALLVVGLKQSVSQTSFLQELKPLTRLEDTSAILPEQRIGLILEDLTHISDPLRVAERIRTLAPKSIDGLAIVALNGKFKKAGEAFEEALKTLKSLKKTGLAKYSEDKQGLESLERLKLEVELEEAINTGNLVTYYQPIFNLNKGTLTGFEALVRWMHPEKGLLLPGAFLAIAERRGHLLKIDEFVLKQALGQIPIWNAGSDRPIYVSVNLCSDHFLRADNLGKLIETLNTQPQSLDLLRVDVSEQVLFEQNGIESLKTLDMLRIGFNLDDFGVDSESFHCLGSFPFNSLKIDRTLINQMEDEVNAELIVAVLRIAKRMGMKTIAEGVVTHAQLEELRNLGCTEAQGFLFSEAVDTEEAGALINTEYRW